MPRPAPTTPRGDGQPVEALCAVPWLGLAVGRKKRGRHGEEGAKSGRLPHKTPRSDQPPPYTGTARRSGVRGSVLTAAGGSMRRRGRERRSYSTVPPIPGSGAQHARLDRTSGTPQTKAVKRGAGTGSPQRRPAGTARSGEGVLRRTAPGQTRHISLVRLGRACGRRGGPRNERTFCLCSLPLCFQ